MAMQLSMIMVIALAAFTPARSARVVKKSTGALQPKLTEETVKCNALGESGGAQGMSVTWGVPKSQCMARCGPVNGQKPTYEGAFADAFTVTFDTKCKCLAGGKEMVHFQAINKAQAQECATGTSANIREMCWRRYMRARGTRFTGAGKARVPRYNVPWSQGDFFVKRMCKDTCQGKSCNDIKLPGILDDMDREDKIAIGEAIKTIMDGKGDEVPSDLKRLVEGLPEDTLDDAEFQAIDSDGDGSLTLDELVGFYHKFTPEQIKHFIRGSDGLLGPEEFQDFKFEMRNFNLNVDLITGDVEFAVEDGEVIEAKPEPSTDSTTSGGTSKPIEDGEGSDAKPEPSTDPVPSTDISKPIKDGQVSEDKPDPTPSTDTSKPIEDGEASEDEASAPSGGMSKPIEDGEGSEAKPEPSIDPPTPSTDISKPIDHGQVEFWVPELSTDPAPSTDISKTSGRCTADDLSKLRALPQDTSDSSFGGTVSACGKSSSFTLGFSTGFSRKDFNSCVTNRVGISTPCAQCYAMVGMQGANQCKTKCRTGWCKDGCLGCTASAQAEASTCAQYFPDPPQPC